MLEVIDDAAESNQDGVAGAVSRSPIDEIVREGARRMLEAVIRRYTRAGVVADRDAHRDHMTEGLDEALDLLERPAPVAEEDLMLPVIYSMSMSLDGFNARPTGDIGWTAPDAEQFRFHIEQTRHVAAHRCGRGLYQEKLVWETAEQTMSGEAELEFARIWRPIPRWCSPRTLNSVAGTARLATGDIATEVVYLRYQRML